MARHSHSAMQENIDCIFRMVSTYANATVNQ